MGRSSREDSKASSGGELFAQKPAQNRPCKCLILLNAGCPSLGKNAEKGPYVSC